jgi:glycine C-acetyltransferase
MDSTGGATGFPANEIRLDRARGLTRSLQPLEGSSAGSVKVQGRTLIDFSSNDYLGLAHHPALIDEAGKALREWGAGSRASRLMSGDLAIHHLLEQELAVLKGGETCLLFGSGYLANMGVIPALCSPGDVVFFDRLSHASMVDGVLLSGARFLRFRHNDPGHLESLLGKHRGKYRRALIAVESLYSMEGDMAPIAELIELKNRFGAMLMVDEAHATGVFGAAGEGLVSPLMTREVDVVSGTFGKALGGYGAFAVVSGEMKSFLLNRARTFIFSTALPPSVVGANRAAVRLLEEEPWRRRRVLEAASRLRTGLKERLGLETPSRSQIVPVILGDNSRALRVSDRLLLAGFFVKAIRPPTIPQGTARIRLSLTAVHTDEDVSRLLEAISHGL